MHAARLCFRCATRYVLSCHCAPRSGMGGSAVACLQPTSPTLTHSHPLCPPPSPLTEFPSLALHHHHSLSLSLITPITLNHTHHTHHTQGEVLKEYGKEWDRVLITTLAVANKRLYELRLQTSAVRHTDCSWGTLFSC